MSDPADPQSHAAAPLSIDEVRKVARLARLELTDADAERYGRDLASVLALMARLQRLDLSGVEPLTHVAGEDARTREDDAAAPPGLLLDSAALSKIAPAMHDAFLKVPKVLGGGEGGGA
ncbi:MAG: Asp-tRNA(Asn)/Glu-tRNA(Gln) amidotransferase subunit GatC [Phycisphaerales bacterium]|nr:MAG: Asp-tRNA(Asn)/Glu-tRNA(Gln) amidotransferase subunit GatC [Phycisphaerales bacterium]